MSFNSKEAAIPPGTIEISPNFFADMTEITNVDWLEYMHWTKRIYGENSNEYKSMLPDTTVWKDENLKGIKSNYYRQPTYSTYPVVGITYEQAKQFCKWRSDRVNESIWVAKTGKKSDYVKNFDYNYEDMPKVFEYRLPTKEEWMEITQNRKVKDIDKETKHLTYPASSSKKKAFYGLNTNVSEMISENGIALGGNWKTPDGYQEIKYEKGSNVVGFRCVCDRKINE
jgi:formylglycine-generating enzyme required for sulfatase activity